MDAIFETLFDVNTGTQHRAGVLPALPGASARAMRRLRRSGQAGCLPYIIAGAVALSLTAVAQELSGHATDFVSVEYYENSSAVKSKMTGAEAIPMSDSVVQVKQLHFEMFNTNGQPYIIVSAPECVYDKDSDTASSAGELHLQNADGSMRMDGRGFLWRRDDSLLTISNNVQTVIKNATALDLPKTANP